MRTPLIYCRGMVAAFLLLVVLSGKARSGPILSVSITPTSGATNNNTITLSSLTPTAQITGGINGSQIGLTFLGNQTSNGLQLFQVSSNMLPSPGGSDSIMVDIEIDFGSDSLTIDGFSLAGSNEGSPNEVGDFMEDFTGVAAPWGSNVGNINFPNLDPVFVDFDPNISNISTSAVGFDPATLVDPAQQFPGTW